MSKCLHDLQGMSKGMSKVAESFLQMQTECVKRNLNQLITNDLGHIKHDLENKFVQVSTSSPKENAEKLLAKANAFAQQASTLLKSDAFNIRSKIFTTQTRSYHTINQRIHLNNSLKFRNYSQKN